MDFLRDSYSSTFITTAATTAVTGATSIPVTCKLIRIIVGETAAGAIKVYDDVSGGATTQKAELKASIAEGDFDYGITMAKGIQVVTLAASKITVVWSKV